MFQSSNTTSKTPLGRRAPEHAVTVTVRPLFTNVFGKLQKTTENENKSYTLNVHNIGSFEKFCAYLETGCSYYKNAAKDDKMMWHFEQPYDAEDPASQLYKAQMALDEYNIPDHDKKIMLLLRLPRDVRGDYIELILDTDGFGEFAEKLIEAVGMPEQAAVKKASDKGKEPDIGILDVCDDFGLVRALKYMAIDDDIDELSELIDRSMPRVVDRVKFNGFIAPRAKTCIYCQSTEHLKRGCQLLTSDMKAKRVKIVNGIVCHMDGTQVPINARNGGMVAIVRGKTVAGGNIF